MLRQNGSWRPATVPLQSYWAAGRWLAKLPWLRLRQVGFFTHGLQRLAANSCHRVSQQPRRLFTGLPNRVPFGLMTCDLSQKGKTVGHHRQPLRFCRQSHFQRVLSIKTACSPSVYCSNRYLFNSG